MGFNPVIASSTAIGGTDRPEFQADLGIRHGGIAAIDIGPFLIASQTRDMACLTVAPSFIKVLSYPDELLSLSDHNQISVLPLLQGVIPVLGESLADLLFNLSGRHE